MPQMYEVVISAIGEVRDKDGNLKSSEPIQTTLTLSEDQIRELQGDES